jgi:two-component system, chemotaxis family, protein-glutamate methylesterase/glutaminase
MPTHDIIVVGASAGGVETLIELVAGFSMPFQGSLFIVLHIPADAPSALSHILARYCVLPVETAQDQAPIVPGHIYTAPASHHLLLMPTAMRLTRGPEENRHRPAIDPLFRTAALAFGPRLVGVILSGALNDGTAGLLEIKRCGGIAIVQDPKTALFSSMPASACTYVDVDWCLPVQDIPAKLTYLTESEIAESEMNLPISNELKIEAGISGLDPSIFERNESVGTLSAISCPTCKGPLWEIQDDRLIRYRCCVGHAFTAESVAEALGESVEDALWAALNTLEESSLLYSRLAADAQSRHHSQSAKIFNRKQDEAMQRARIIRDALVDISSENTSRENKEVENNNT